MSSSRHEASSLWWVTAAKARVSTRATSCAGVRPANISSKVGSCMAHLTRRRGSSQGLAGGRAARGVNPVLQGHTEPAHHAALAVPSLQPGSRDIALKGSSQVCIDVGFHRGIAGPTPGSLRVTARTGRDRAVNTSRCSTWIRAIHFHGGILSEAAAIWPFAPQRRARSWWPWVGGFAYTTASVGPSSPDTTERRPTRKKLTRSAMAESRLRPAPKPQPLQREVRLLTAGLPPDTVQLLCELLSPPPIQRLWQAFPAPSPFSPMVTGGKQPGKPPQQRSRRGGGHGIRG